MKKILLICHLFTLIFGGLIYVSFRSYNLKMFRWFEFIGIDDLINSMRKITMNYNVLFPNWFLYSLPDGLWIFSYTCLMFYIWNNKVTLKNIFWIFIIPTSAIISELGQMTKYINGTFDILDLAFYFFGLLLPFILFKNSFNFKTQNL